MKVIKFFIFLFPIFAMSQVEVVSKSEVLKQKGKYEYVYNFENSYAVFRTFDHKMGVVDTTGKIIIKPTFSYIYNKKELKNLFEVGNETNKKFKRGFIDLKGNIKIPIIYDDVYYYEKNLIRVINNNKYGVIDTLNNVILPLKFEYIALDDDILIARNKGVENLFNLNGKPICNLQFTDVSNFINNKAIATLLDKTSCIIDNHGEIVLKTIKSQSFEKMLNNHLYLMRDNLNSKKGILNSTGVFQIKCKYDEIELSKSFFIAENKNKRGIISTTDSIIKPFVYDEIYLGNSDKSADKYGDNHIAIKNKMYGVINPYFEKDVIPLQYKWITSLFDKYFITQNANDKNGLFYNNGDIIIPEKYQFYNNYENKIFASADGKQSIITLENKSFKEFEVTADEFVKYNSEGTFPNHQNQIFRIKSKFGVINIENDVLIPCEYDAIENVYLSKDFIVKKNNKYGIVNTENKIVLEIEYDDFKLIKDYILFTKNKEAVRKIYGVNFR